MRWYNYLSAFLAGAVLVHVAPHLSHGLNITAILIALGILFVTYLLLRLAKFSSTDTSSVLLFFAGFVAILIFDAVYHHHVRLG